MRKYFTFILFLSTTIVLYADANIDKKKANRIALPAYIGFRVDQVIYESASAPQFMGDGFGAYIVKVEKESLAKFIKENISIDRRWTHGSLQIYKRNLGVLVWLEEWMDVHKVKKEINNAYDLKKLKHEKDIYHISITKWESKDGFVEGSLTNATMFFILPKENIVIMFNEDT
jgi:hypothetical protein